MKQFLKLYSKQKELLQTYIDENDIHFDNALEMLQLVKYAHSLK
jgi:DNA polymerase I-like protein with 3'-5' exonuclease and polymerase domains